jgi:CDP-2,3-bis-(O-geranylgeranyl)-sn-glycerol synthase
MAALIGYEEALWALYFIIPAYSSNSLPTIFKGGPPIDGGRLFIDGRRVFGPTKTVRGFLGGLIGGSLFGLLESALMGWGLFPFALLVSAGALLGDLFGSFVKRRLGLPPGFPAPLLDQLDFVLGGLALSCPLYGLPLGSIAILLAITPPIHLAANYLAHRAGLKDRPW